MSSPHQGCYRVHLRTNPCSAAVSVAHTPFVDRINVLGVTGPGDRWRTVKREQRHSQSLTDAVSRGRILKCQGRLRWVCCMISQMDAVQLCFVHEVKKNWHRLCFHGFKFAMCFCKYLNLFSQDHAKQIWPNMTCVADVNQQFTARAHTISVSTSTTQLEIDRLLSRWQLWDRYQYWRHQEKLMSTGLPDRLLILQKLKLYLASEISSLVVFLLDNTKPWKLLKEFT